MWTHSPTPPPTTSLAKIQPPTKSAILYKHNIKTLQWTFFWPLRICRAQGVGFSNVMVSWVWQKGIMYMGAARHGLTGPLVGGFSRGSKGTAASFKLVWLALQYKTWFMAWWRLLSEAGVTKLTVGVATGASSDRQNNGLEKGAGAADTPHKCGAATWKIE